MALKYEHYREWSDCSPLLWLFCFAIEVGVLLPLRNNRALG